MQLASRFSDRSANRGQQRANEAQKLIGPLNHSEETISEMIEMTGAIPLFDKIDSVQVGIIAAHMQIVHLDEKQRLFAEGEQSDYICFVVSGKLEVFKQSQKGRMVSVSTLSKGRCIGEMALMDAYPRSATVVAQSECTLLKITRESFAQILDERPRAGISFLQALSKSLSLQLRKTSGQLADAHDSIAPEGVVPVLNQKTRKESKTVDHIINRKQSSLPPLIRQFI